MTRMAHSPFMWSNRPFEYISLGLSVVWCRSTGTEIVNLGIMRKRVRIEGYAQASAKIRSCRVCSLGLSTEAWVYFPLKSVSFPCHIYIYIPILYTTVHILLQRGNGLLHNLQNGYRVESDQDRMWAWRMDRAVDHHMAVRERDLGKLSDSHARGLRELKDGGLLRWRQRRIDALESRIVAMHKTFHNGRGLGL